MEHKRVFEFTINFWYVAYWLGVLVVYLAVFR
jgi:hypothetical protein